MLARLDRLVTDVDGVLAGPGDAEVYAWMEDVRENMVELRAKAEEKLDWLAL